MPRDRRSVGRLVLAAAALPALLWGGGCGSGPVEDAQARLPAALSAELAKRSDAVAQTLERGDGCGAARQASQLRTAVDRAVAAGSVPAALRVEMRRRAAELLQSIVCVEPAPPPQPPPPGREGGDEEHDDEEDEEDGEDSEDEEDED